MICGRVPNGATCCHRKTSLESADTKGSLGSSSKVGKRSVPITRSISSWAWSCAAGFINIVGKKVKRVRHGLRYMYVITDEDKMLQSSETGALLINYVSKHVGGKARFGNGTANAEADKCTCWELVVDNNSGTHSPSCKMLPELRALLEYNFSKVAIHALDRKSPVLEKSNGGTHRMLLRVWVFTKLETQQRL